MLPDSPSPRAALALSDLQPQTGASTFSVGTGSGNWSTRGVGGVSGDYMDKSGGGMFGNNRNNDRFAFGNNSSSSSSAGCFSSNSSSGGLFSNKCMSGCIDYVTEKCPHKLEKYETIDDEKEKEPSTTRAPKRPAASSRVVGEVDHEQKERFIDSKDIRRAPLAGDAKLLNQEYPITEVTDADLSSECGTEKSQPPFSPCLSRKSADDVFLACCQQQLPSNCHSLCTYEHREHVAAETLIQAIQQEHCDMKHLSALLYCANQNRDNRACCSHLGMSNPELGVGDRCLRMCNVAPSGDRVSSVEKEDLVCLSNWNVVMYCARGGLRTIN